MPASPLGWRSTDAPPTRQWWCGALLVVVAGAGGCAASDEPLSLGDPCWQAPSATAAPLDLRCTGLYEDWDEKRITWSVRPFAPGTILWSDGAHKQRWIELPGVIDASNPDEWIFPVGTKAWKEFSLEGRRVETRLFHKIRADRWVRATYVWSADGSTATRRDRGTPNFEGTGYTIPSVSDCDKCHEGRVDRLLGFEAIGLGEPSVDGLTLEGLVREGRIWPPIDPRAARLPPSLPEPTRAALQWMHVNCGTSCHNRAIDSTAMSTELFLRLELGQLAAPGDEQGSALDPVASTVGVQARIAKWAAFRRVVPGSTAQSLLYRLAASRGAEQMPPILSHLPDPEGTRVLRTWMDSLGPPAPASGAGPPP